MDENYDVRNDYEDENEKLKDPGRQERWRPEEPWIESELRLLTNCMSLYLVSSVWYLGIPMCYKRVI